MVAPAELKMIGEKALYHTAKPHLLAYCPSVELLALGSTDEQVSLFRLNGQRVWAIAQKVGSPKVERISWKPNGQLLAVAWNDGIVRLVGVERSKTIHQISAVTQRPMGITCLNWTSNYTFKRTVGSSQGKGGRLWNELVEEKLDKQEGRDLLDLPRDLSLIDIESSLPKLSVLPASSTSDDIFSSRTSLDGLFGGLGSKDNNVVDVLVVGTEDGGVHLSIYDSFVIGSFPSPLSRVGHQSSIMVRHASHKSYTTHGLIMTSAVSPRAALYFGPMDLRFVSASGEYLSLVASKSTALQNLLRYVHQVQILMNAEWQATQDLPNRFLGNINEVLEENNKCSIVQAMYHSVATGHTFPAVREWLLDELAERGHKRWDKAVTSSLGNLRKLVHEHMLPALERCTLIMSRLAGIVKYQGLNDTMGFSSRRIDLIMDTLACLNLLSARILTYVVDEIDLFAAFSAWLRHEIDRLASDSSSAPSEDAAEKEPSIDHSKVLLYIQTAMTNSRLSAFFEQQTAKDGEKDDLGVEQGLPMFELLDKELQKHASGLPYKQSLPRVDLLCKHLGAQTAVMFQQIADAEKRNVMFGEPTMLGSWDNGSPLDIRLCPEDYSYCRVYIAFIPAEQSHLVRIFTIQLKIENGVSTKISMAETAINFGSVEIKDISFLDDRSLLVLCVYSGEKTNLISIPFRVNDAALSYYSSHAPPAEADIDTIDEILPHCDTYLFPDGALFTPEKIEVSETNKKRDRDDSARLCVLDKGMIHYRVFTIQKAKTGPPAIDEDVSMG